MKKNVIISFIVLLIGAVVLFMPRDTSQKQALALVKNLPEVQEYINVLQTSGKEATFEVEDLDDDWNVHVFEIVQQEEASHTATFGWYQISKKTGEVKKDTP